MQRYAKGNWINTEFSGIQIVDETRVLRPNSRSALPRVREAKEWGQLWHESASILRYPRLLIQENKKQKKCNSIVIIRNFASDIETLKNLQSRLWTSPSPTVAFQSRRSIAGILDQPFASTWPKYKTTNDNRTGGRPWAHWLQQDLLGSTWK